MCVSINNFKFSKYRKLKCGNFSFRCTNKKCKAIATLNPQCTSIINHKNEHNHSEYSENAVHKDIIRSSVKRKAVEEMHTQPSKIIRRELLLKSDYNLNHGDMHLLRNSMYATRKKHFPKLPNTVNEAVLQLKEFQVKFKDEQFLYFSDDNSVVLFTCSTNLSALCDAPHVFGDGTFSYCPKLFTQLYTIHIYQNYFYVPVVFCFLEDKHTSTYTTMWEKLQNFCTHILDRQLIIKEFHVDFEKSAHSSILNVFPQCKIVCCTFHLAQSWFRRIQKSSKLLQEYKNNNSEVGKWLKYFFGLPYLPSDEIEIAFSNLIAIAPPDGFYFSDYVFSSYILPNSNFNPSLWAGKPDDLPRTTNGAEAFHRHFNNQFYNPHPHVYQVIDVILNIQSETDLKLNSIKMNINNYRRKEMLQTIEYMKNLWTKYTNNEIDQLNYLEQMGNRFQGKPLK